MAPSPNPPQRHTCIKLPTIPAWFYTDKTCLYSRLHSILYLFNSVFVFSMWNLWVWFSNVSRPTSWRVLADSRSSTAEILFCLHKGCEFFLLCAMTEKNSLLASSVFKVRNNMFQMFSHKLKFTQSLVKSLKKFPYVHILQIW